MAGVAQSLAGGDLRVRVTPRSDQDGFGKAFVAMIEKLSAGDRRGSLRRERALRRLGQVSASAQTLSQGTSEQAASVQETTSSLEQMSASITQNAENSRQMEQMAVKGARDADESARAVDDTSTPCARSPRRSRSSRRSRTRRTCSR